MSRKDLDRSDQASDAGGSCDWSGITQVHDLFGDRVLRGRGKVHRAELDAGSKRPVLECDSDGLQSGSVQKKAPPVPGRFRPLAVHEAQSLEFLDSAVTPRDRNPQPP